MHFSETAAEKPSFRAAFKHRRCLLPATGFYEWKKTEKIKQPYFIRMRDEKPFVFAGLWERWHGENDNTIESCTILTTEPNELMSTLHNRMPAILKPEDYDYWLEKLQLYKDNNLDFLIIKSFKKFKEFMGV